VLSGGAPGRFYCAGEGAHAPGNGQEWAAALWPAVSALNARGRWGDEARRHDCYWKGEQLGGAAEGRASSARPTGGGGFVAKRLEEEDEGAGPARQ
jgi:hypothetical protein